MRHPRETGFLLLLFFRKEKKISTKELCIMISSLEFKPARKATQFSPSQSRLGLQTAEQQEAVRIT